MRIEFYGLLVLLFCFLLYYKQKQLNKEIESRI
jgi:hypothetical protein